VKADGLAAGKGVVVAATIREAKEAVDLIMQDKAFGAAGNTIVIEECLLGEEDSFLAFTDGRTVVALPTSQDHKAIFDEDKGPNTGGMGAYSPAPVVTPPYGLCRSTSCCRRSKAWRRRQTYKGILYAGLMIHGVHQVLNSAPFSDRGQPLLMRIDSDIVEIFGVPSTAGSVRRDQTGPRPCVCGHGLTGYPGTYATARPSKGIKNAQLIEGVEVFHAGTRRLAAGRLPAADGSSG
jgi:phosphoribosylamine--glycine ligase